MNNATIAKYSSKPCINILTRSSPTSSIFQIGKSSSIFQIRKCSSEKSSSYSKVKHIALSSFSLEREKPRRLHESNLSSKNGVTSSKLAIELNTDKTTHTAEAFAASPSFFDKPQGLRQSNVRKTYCKTSLHSFPVAMTFNWMLFSRGIESETENTSAPLEKLAKWLNLSIPEKKTPESFFFLTEKCFQAAYSKCKQGEWESLKDYSVLLENLKDNDGHTLLTYAILSKDEAVAKKLIELNIGKDQRDSEGNSSLHLAVEAGLVELFPLLKESLNLKNNKGETPLHLAIRADEAISLQELIQLGAPLTDFKAIPPIALAIAYESQKVFSLLATEKSIQTSVKGGNLLHFAIKKQSTGMLKHILDKGGRALIEQKDLKERTPLAIAAYVGDEEAIRLLFQQGASLDSSDANNPIYWAIRGNHPNALLYLLQVFKIEEQALHSFRSFASSISNQPLADFIQKAIGTLWLPKNQPPENLVIKGGGPKGIAFIGALKKLEEREALINLKRVVGTSSGAIVASLLAVGSTSGDVHKILQDHPVDTLLDPPEALQKDLQSFLTKLPDFEKEIKKIQEEGVGNNKLNIGKKLLRAYWSWWWSPTAKKKAIKEQWAKGGLCSGNELFEIINLELSKKIKALTGEDIDYLTFGKLNEYIASGKYPDLKHLFVIATQIGSDPKSVTFSSNDVECKDIIIASAVRASMSIPLVFVPTTIQKLEGGKPIDAGRGKFVDGGLLDNYPIDKLDQKQYKKGNLSASHQDDPWINPYTWGLSLYSSEEKKTKDESPDIKDIIFDCMHTYMGAEATVKKNKQKIEARTIDIDNQGVSLIDFTKDSERDQKLIRAGKFAVVKFLENAKLSPLGKANLYYNLVNIDQKRREGKFNLPSPHPFFIHRKELLEKLESHFVTQRTCILVGPGGRGKSVLANAYAYANAEKFSLIFWIDSETSESEEIGYRALAQILQIPIQKESEEVVPLTELKEAIFHALESLTEPYLLILDNAEELPKNLPRKGGSILITTQKPSLPGPSIKIPPFELNEACTLLEEATGEKRSPAMESLVKEQLYFSPLLTRIAAHYIASIPELTISGYSKALEKNKEELIDAHDPDGGYSKSLKTVYKITLDHLQKQEPLALEFLKESAYLSPDHISIGLIDSYLGLTIKSSSQQEYYREKILKALEQYSLIERQKEFDTFSIHRETQGMILPIDPTISPSTMIDILNHYPSVSEYNPMNKGTTVPFQKVIPHCVSLLKAKAPVKDPKQRAQLALALVRYYIESEGNFEEAEHSLKTIENGPPFKSIEGRVHFYRGMIRRKEGKHIEAEQEFQQAQQCFEDDEDTNHYLQKENNRIEFQIEQNQIKCTREYQTVIAKIYRAQSLKDQDKSDLVKLDKVDRLLEACKKEIIDLLGQKHFDVFRIIREQAEIRFLLGRYDEAEPLVKESLKRQREIYGELFDYKPPVAVTFSLLGDIYLKMKALDKAIEAYEETLKINKNIYGDMHRYTARAYEKLSEAYRVSNDINLAKHYEEKVLEIKKALKKKFKSGGDL